MNPVLEVGSHKTVPGRLGATPLVMGHITDLGPLSPERRTPPPRHRPEILVKDRWMTDRIRDSFKAADVRSGLGSFVRSSVLSGELTGEQLGELLDRLTRVIIIESALYGTVYRNEQVSHLPTIKEIVGLLSRKVVTTVGAGYIVDAFQNLVELENMKYHGYGTGSTAEAVGDTALVTELTTEYVGDVRPTGSQTEASATVYRTIATLAPDSGGTIVLREHGIFSANAAGVLLDRSVYAIISLVASLDSLATTYDFTVTAGS